MCRSTSKKFLWFYYIVNGKRIEQTPFLSRLNGDGVLYLENPQLLLFSSFFSFFFPLFLFFPFFCIFFFFLQVSRRVSNFHTILPQRPPSIAPFFHYVELMKCSATFRSPKNPLLQEYSPQIKHVSLVDFKTLFLWGEKGG